MSASHDLSGAVVLTTHERSGYFTSILGDDIDLRLNPHSETALRDLLHNTNVVGGGPVVIDEASFIDTDDLAGALEHFFQNEPHPDRLKLIVVCTHRKAGDLFLAFLVMYCGIYNIIYDKTGIDVCLELARLLKCDNRRSDVLHLAEAGRWREAKLMQERSRDNPDQMLLDALAKKDAVEAFKDIHGEYLIDVKDLDTISVRLIVSAVLAKM